MRHKLSVLGSLQFKGIYFLSPLKLGLGVDRMLPPPSSHLSVPSLVPIIFFPLLEVKKEEVDH